MNITNPYGKLPKVPNKILAILQEAEEKKESQMQTVKVVQKILYTCAQVKKKRRRSKKEYDCSGKLEKMYNKF